MMLLLFFGYSVQLMGAAEVLVGVGGQTQKETHIRTQKALHIKEKTLPMEKGRRKEAPT